MTTKPDIDPQETQEWLDALEAVLENEGTERAHFLIERLVDKARRSGAYLPFSANTAYLNTIPPTHQPRFPGDRAMERRIRSFIRWNAMAMVVQANRLSTELGGHISSFSSAATLFDIGFNHFFTAPPRSTAETWSFSRATRPRAFTPAPSWRGASARSSSTTSARRWTATASPPIRIRS
jgi:pyruvate dehydrogenase E1 component